MTSINASTTHSVKTTKKKVKNQPVAIGRATGVTTKKSTNAKSKTATKKSTASSSSSASPAVGRRGSTAPPLQPQTLSTPQSISSFQSSPVNKQRDQITEWTRRALGESLHFSSISNAATPHTASTTRDRAAAAADIAVAVHALGPILVLKKFGVLTQLEQNLMPHGIAALFGGGDDNYSNTDGGKPMSRVSSALSLSSLGNVEDGKNDLNMTLNGDGGGVVDTGFDTTASICSTNTGVTDSKRGKTTPATAREGCLLLLRALCEVANRKEKKRFAVAAIEPYVVPFLAAAIDEAASSSGAVREAAEDTSVAVVSIAHPLAVPRLIVPVLFDALTHSPEWRVKQCALERLTQCAVVAPKRIASMLPQIVPIVTEQIWDTKPKVTRAASSALLAVCQTNLNPDIKPTIPAVVGAIVKPSETNKAIDALCGTTFVAPVDASTLSILCPVLSRGLKEKMALHKRSACIVIENMSRLVDSPEAVAPFGPLLLPELKKVAANVQFEEIRDAALAALSALTKALGHASTDDAVDQSLSALALEESKKVEEERRRIEAEREAERRREEEMQAKEEEERKKWKEGMEAQRLLEQVAIREEEEKKAEELKKREAAKLSTKGTSGKCKSCGLKKCKKTCMFYHDN